MCGWKRLKISKVAKFKRYLLKTNYNSAKSQNFTKVYVCLVGGQILSPPATHTQGVSSSVKGCSQTKSLSTLEKTVILTRH